MDKKSSEWFSNEVVFWRYSTSIFWTIVVQVSIIPVAVVCTSFMFNTGGIFSSVVLCIMSLFFTVVFAVLHISNVTVVPRTTGTLLQAGRAWLNLWRWSSIASFSILGALSIKCFGGVLGNYWIYDETMMCATEGVNCCLNEKNLFNLLHGGFVGVVFGCSYFSNSCYLLEFPTIEQLKFSAMKMKMKDLLVTSALSVFTNLKWFYVAYYFLGNIIKSFATEMTESTFCNRASLTSLRGLADFHLLWVTWMSAVVLCVVWSSFIAIFQIIMTENYKFEIETVLEKDAHKTLKSGLQCPDPPIMQYLALKDFSFLSQHSVVRRGQIFQISDPGGHPLQWSAVCGHALGLVDRFLEHLVQVSSGSTVQKLPNKPIQTPTKEDIKSENRSSLSTSFSTPAPYKRRFIKNLASPVAASEQSYVCYEQQQQAYTPNNAITLSKMFQWFSSKVSQLMSKVKMTTFVKYLITETPEAKLEKVFVCAQPVIWAVQGLCFMVRASLYEDEYGVVQKWLPDILSKLLDLQTALERSQKMLTKKQNQVKRSVQLRQRLRVALSTGLYCIVCSFQQHLRSIKLTDEHRQRLQQYENFMT